MRREGRRRRDAAKYRRASYVHHGVYVDARHVQTRRGGRGGHAGCVVYRDGVLIAASCERVEASNSTEAEAMAVSIGVEAATRFGFGVVYTDNAAVAAMISGSATIRPWKNHAEAVNAARSAAAAVGVRVEVVDRDCNVPAHVAASRGTRNPGFPVYARAEPLVSVGDYWPEDAPRS